MRKLICFFRNKLPQRGFSLALLSFLLGSAVVTAQENAGTDDVIIDVASQNTGVSEQAFADVAVGELDTTVVTESTFEPPAPPPRIISAPAPLPRPVVVDQVVESATRTEKKISDVPSTIGVITEDEIARVAPLSFDDLIRTEPNVETLGGPRYLGEQLIIRAQGGNAVTVRIDDARQNFVSGHSGQRFFVEPDFMQEVEILRGGGSFLYGSGAGGVVNVSTLDPSDIAKDGRWGGLRIRNSYHTNSDEWANSIIGAVTSEKLDLMIGTSDRDGDNIHLADDVELPNSSIERESNIAKLVLRPTDEQTLTFTVFDYKSLDQGAANPQGDVDSATNPFVGRTVDYLQWTANWEWNPIGNDLIDVDATFYYNNTNQVRNYLDTTGSNVGRQNVHDLDVFGIDIRNRSVVDWGGVEHELVYGIDFFSEKQDGTESRNTFFAPGSVGSSSGRPDAEADHFAAYITDEFDVTEKLTLFTGVRFDMYDTLQSAGAMASQSDSALSPHIGFDLDLNEHWSLVGKYSRAFTEPTLNDLYQQGSHFGIVPLTDPNEVFGAFERFDAQTAQQVNVNEPFLVFPPFGPPIPVVNDIPAPDTPQAVTQDEFWFEEVFVQNADLLPEESHNFELGLHYENEDVAGGSLSARFTGFFQQGKNTFDTEIVGTRTTNTSILGVEDIPAVDPVSFPGPGGPFAAPTTFLFPTGGGLDFNSQFTQAFRQTVNRAETEIYGFEAAVDYDADFWFGSLTYGSVRGEDVITGRKLNSTTGDQLALTLGIRPIESLELGAYGIWNGGRENLVSDPFSQTGAYDIYGLFATFQATEVWSIRVGVDNLFDQAYERSTINQQEPGRNVVISSTLHW